jgi:ABC-2 type transport system ATP-binding protein
MHPKPIIETKDLFKKFGRKNRPATNGVSLKIYPGQVIGLIGPNSSGKSTLQRMLATVLKPTSGSIKYNGRHVRNGIHKDRLRRNIGYVPQGDCLYGDLTIEENLLLFSEPYGIKKRTRKKRIESLLEQLQLTERRKYLVKNLSGGMAKRASIAAALVHNPKIVFMDEVTMGLDPTSRLEIWKLVRELKENKITIIMTTHYLNEVQSLCDNVFILSKGNLVEDDTPTALLEKYRTDDLDDVIQNVIKSEA